MGVYIFKQYIQLRFKSNFFTSCISFLYILRTILYAGLCLYAPTIALVAVSPFDYMTYILLLGGICTLYSAFGGIRAVVWTDVYQFSFMVIGLMIILILGFIDLGGFGKAWSIASKGGRLDMFNMDLSIYVRHTFYKVILTGTISGLSMFGIDQINVQRLSSVNSFSDAKKILLINTIIGLVLIYLLLFTGGIVVYAIYAECDPLAQGLIKRKDEILPFLILDRLNYVGLAGLFVATLIGGTLSSVSSVINAVGAMLWRNVLLKISFFKDGSSTLAMVANKSLSLLTGCLCIGSAIIFSNAGGLMQVVLSFMSLFAGPFLAIFLLGVLFPRCNYKGALAGISFSFLLVGWIAVGAFLYAEKPALLPLSTEKCNITSASIINSTFYNATEVVIQNSSLLMEEEISENNFNLMWLYDISYTLYGSIGLVSCLFTAVLVSYLTGWQDLDEVNPECIAPFIRKFYWPANQQIFLNDQQELDKLTGTTNNTNSETNDL